MEQQKYKLPLRSFRLEALGDGIFAVAITILAIDLKWPVLQNTSFSAFTNAFYEILPGLICGLAIARYLNTLVKQTGILFISAYYFI